MRSKVKDGGELARPAHFADSRHGMRANYWVDRVDARHLRSPEGVERVVDSWVVMKAVILAGGYGTRLAEETVVKPKPMVEIGGKPILWHIMKTYSSYGIHEFVICCGYRGYVIKEYFVNYFLHTSDVTIDVGENRMEVHHRTAEPWKVTLVDTGESTMTGGRLRRVAQYLSENEPFCFTYGDGVSDVDIAATLRFHAEHGRLATVTAVVPPGRFGALQLDGAKVRGFLEKPDGDGQCVNGGFFVLSPRVVTYIDGDFMAWEREPLSRLAADGELMAYQHYGFWQPMDTLRDMRYLEELWSAGRAPWKTW
jgi:glucose-1-phosphate cytidylyltransferase